MHKFSTPLIIIYLIIIFYGCLSSKIEEKNCYKTILVDSTFFNEYWLIMVEDKNKIKKYILSEKKDSISEEYLKNDSIINEKNLCIEIKKVDTLVNASLSGIVSQDNPEIYLDDQLIWSEGKIRVPVYVSDCIQDRYIIINCK